ncbi:MAG: response regulator, partial [Oscillospiraceae bacterium]
MNIIAVDDERLVLEDFIDICSSIPDVNKINTFSNPADALEHAALNSIDMAFLDIEMPVMTGLDLAQRLNRINPDTKIVFVTGFKDYAFDAFSVNAIGYVLKPFSDDMIKNEIEKAKRIINISENSKISVKTFGYFDVFVDDKPVYFSSAKSKELLALLIDRRGGSVSSENAISALWPERQYDETVQSLFRKVLKSLRTALSDADISHVLIDVRNQRSVDMSKFECDYYSLMKMNENAI